jgi:hypothetical protein
MLALLGCVALAAATSVASGQTNPSDMSYPVPPSSVPQTMPGDLDDSRGSARDDRDGNYAGGLPYRELAPVPQAAERLYVARALHRQAHLHLENVYRSVRRDFEKAGGYLGAASGEREAFQAYADARDAAITKLQTTPSTPRSSRSATSSPSSSRPVATRPSGCSSSSSCRSRRSGCGTTS